MHILDDVDISSGILSSSPKIQWFLKKNTLMHSQSLDAKIYTSRRHDVTNLFCVFVTISIKKDFSTKFRYIFSVVSASPALIAVA